MCKALSQQNRDDIVLFGQSLGVPTDARFSLSFYINNVIHTYSGKYHDPASKVEKLGTVGEIMERLDLKEVDGVIKVNPATNDVYQVYESDRPNEISSYNHQVENWIQAIRAEIDAGSEGYIQYLTEAGNNSEPEGTIIVDFTEGKNHKVTTFRLDQGHTVDYLKSEVPSTVKLQDNSIVIGWSKTFTSQ